jgi:hypothetical protein
MWLAAAAAVAVIVPTAGIAVASAAGSDNARGRAQSPASVREAPADKTAAVNRDAVSPAVEGKAAPATFKHPGVLLDRTQLDVMKKRATSGDQVFKNAYNRMRTSKYASLSWKAKPRANVECGSRSNPNNGCSDEREDAMGAYTHALLWYITGDAKHAKKAVEIMDAWSAKIKQHTNHNAPLQTGWAGASFARAAEIIRHTSKAWPAAGVDRFETMLRNVYLPILIKGKPNTNGNWELIMTDAAIGIAVFLDDRASFDKAVQLWRKRLPAYIYLKSDGALPKPPAGGNKNSKDKIIKYWHGQTTFVDGLSQETCRDFGHTGWGFAAAAHVAETAGHQGVDLHAEGRQRLAAAFEFHAQFDLGKKAPGWLCKGKVSTGLGPVGEVAFNRLRNAGKVGSLTQTKKLVETKRPAGTSHFLGWETLTHAENP